MQSNPAEPQPSPRRFVAPPIREVGLDAVVRWLQLGWHDLRASGWPSLMHGLIVTAVSVVIVEMTLFFWPLLPGAVSGFLVVGPILATGLYALSRQLEQGVKPDTRHVYEAWRRGTRCLYRFGLLLVLATPVRSAMLSVRTEDASTVPLLPTVVRILIVASVGSAARWPPARWRWRGR